MTHPLEAAHETRERILDAAEYLFGQRGFESVSLREITGRAGANVAAVNYHFGSKEKLVDAVVVRHAVPINDGRLRLLLEAEERLGEEPVPVREILVAFLRPVIDEIGREPGTEEVICKFMGRIMSEQGYQLPESVQPLFEMMAGRFAGAFRKALPGLSEEEALWRMHFSFGVMSSTLLHRDKLEQISRGRSGNPGMEDLLTHIIDFCVAGFESGRSPEGGRESR